MVDAFMRYFTNANSLGCNAMVIRSGFLSVITTVSFWSEGDSEQKMNDSYTLKRHETTKYVIKASIIK